MARSPKEEEGMQLMAHPVYRCPACGFLVDVDEDMTIEPHDVPRGGFPSPSLNKLTLISCVAGGNTLLANWYRYSEEG